MPLAALSYILILASIALIVYALFPRIVKKTEAIHEKRVEESVSRLNNLFIFSDRRKVFLLIFLAPIVFALIGWLLLKGVFGIVIGAALGLIAPNVVINTLKSRRHAAFSHQFIDGIMIISTALRGGLSLTQSIEVLCEETPSPIKDEFGLLLREVKIGVDMGKALDNLSKRMPSEEMDLFVSSVLVARETGGNLTTLFSRLIDTIRDRNQLREKIATYTIQGKIQGFVMSALPFLFVIFVYKVNPHHFDVMFNNPLGKILLVVAVGLQILALVLIKMFSTIKI